jgi:hypothetical protein
MLLERAVDQRVKEAYPTIPTALHVQTDFRILEIFRIHGTQAFL